MPIPIGHIPCSIAHSQVSGTSHQRIRLSSRVRSQAVVVTATSRKLSTCGRIDRPLDAARRARQVSPAASSGPAQRRAER